MSSEDMVERVARAIDEATLKYVAGSNNSLDILRTMQARVAIEAMREPTEGMVEAGWKSKSDSVDGRPVWKLSVDVQAKHQYVAMIDAALSGPQDPPHPL